MTVRPLPRSALQATFDEASARSAVERAQGFVAQMERLLAARP